MSVYLFMKRYTAEEMYRPHQGFYRPRLSNCSDYSGQFLHPDAWTGRGRSPSSISSEASLQMNSSNFPALLKCPEYEQISSSPCWRWAIGAHTQMLKSKNRKKISLKMSLKICHYPAWIPIQSVPKPFFIYTTVGELLLLRFCQFALFYSERSCWKVRVASLVARRGGNLLFFQFSLAQRVPCVALALAPFWRLCLC